LTILLSIFVLIFAIFYIRAEYRGPRRHVYIFKPLTTSLIIIIALTTVPPVSTFYKYVIVAGLLFSLAGDIFLMLPADRFMAGLISFFVAHVAYIVAFASSAGGYTSLWGLLPFLIYGLIIFGLLAPHPDNLKIPVAAYVMVILLMGWQALGQWIQIDRWGTLLALFGALLFIASDSVLAIDRFKQPFKSARLIVLSTYFSAQWLIALSIGA